jgi:hypothetical protein
MKEKKKRLAQVGGNNPASLSIAAIIDRSSRPSEADSEYQTKSSIAQKNKSADEPKFSRKYTDEQKQAMDKAGIGKSKTGESIKASFDKHKNNFKTKLRQGLVDQYASFKDILQDKRAWMLSALTNSSNGALEAAMEYGSPVLKDGVITVDTKKKSLKSILKPLGDELDDWLLWQAGHRAARLKKRDKERLFSNVDIDALKSLNQGRLKNGGSREALYESVRNDFEDMGAAINQIAVDTGLIGAEQAKTWKNEGFYVPFYRILQEDNAARGPQMSGGLTRQTAFKKLKGADIPLNDLMSNVLMNWSHLLGASLKNQAARAALESAESMGLAEKVNTHTKSKKAIWIRKDGQQIYYDLDGSDEGQLVLNSLMSLNYSGMNNFAMKTMRKFKRALTIGVTASPSFKVANLIRDSIHSIAVADMDVNIVKNVANGWQATKKDSDTIAQMIAGGGAFGDSGYVHGADPDAIKILVDKGVARETILTGKYIKKFWNKYQDFGARMENVNRAAAFEKKIGEGKSLLEANFESRDLLDFSRTGSFEAVRMLSQVVPFLNARLQGLDKMARGVADPKQRKQFATVMATYGLISVALYLSMKDDDDYKEAEDWERDAYHMFKLPGSDIMYRIPRPFEVGSVATLLERAVEQAVNDDVHGELFAERLGHVLKDTLAMNPVPQAFMPVLEVWANKNSFTGRRIESMGMERMSPSERKKAWTSTTAIGLSAAMDKITWGNVVMSPVQIEHVVNGYLGWAGGTILATSDMLYRQAADTPSVPGKHWTEYPVVKRFAREGEGRHSKYTTQFYDNLQEVSRAWGDIKQAREFHELEKEKSLLEEHSGKLKHRKYYNRVMREMSKKRKEMMRVKLNKTMSSKMKQLKLKQLQRQYNRISRLAVEKTKDAFD